MTYETMFFFELTQTGQRPDLSGEEFHTHCPRLVEYLRRDPLLSAREHHHGGARLASTGMNIVPILMLFDIIVK